MAKAKKKGRKGKVSLREWNGWAVWNLKTGELPGAGPSEDRAKEVWCMTRGPTVYGRVQITEAKGAAKR